ncbi:hypothetical protein LINPERHAP2_LOCUS1005 [Linum perenne]
MIEEGHREVVFETDVELVGSALRDDKEDIFEFGCLISSCKRLLAALPQFNVQVVRRNRNHAAHLLAQRSFSCESPFYGISSPSRMNNVLDIVYFSSGH